MEIRQLKYFVAVSNLGSVTQAAKENHVSQPTITMSMRKLEEELGIALFERGKNTLMLTQQGVLFLERANIILSEVRDTFEIVNDMKADQKQMLRLGIPPFVGAWVLSIIFTRYTQEKPNLDLLVHDLGSNEVFEALVKDEIDLGLAVLDGSLGNMDHVIVSEGEVLVLVPKGHPFEEVSEVPFEWLAGEPLIMCGAGTYVSNRLYQEFERCSITPNVIYTSTQLVSVLSLVGCGAGLSFILDDSIMLIKDSSTLVTRPLKVPISYNAGFVWRSDKYLSDAAQDLLGFFTKG